MRFPIPQSLLLAGFVSAESRGPLAEDRSLAARGLLAARVLSDNKTCAEAWGAGSVICSLYNCFNPTLGEQCCGKGYNCVGSDNSCCGALGPGITGTDGVPTPSTLPDPTSSISLPGSFPTSSSCLGQSGEECCQRLSSSQHWCSGSYPNFLCYNPGSQSCCSDGSRCIGDGCCAFVGATAITPNITQATARPSSSAPNSVTSAPTAAQTGTTPSTNLVATTTSANVGPDQVAMRNAMGGVAVAAIGALGMALL